MALLHSVAALINGFDPIRAWMVALGFAVLLLVWNGGRNLVPALLLAAATAAMIPISWMLRDILSDPYFGWVGVVEIAFIGVALVLLLLSGVSALWPLFTRKSAPDYRGTSALLIFGYAPLIVLLALREALIAFLGAIGF